VRSAVEVTAVVLAIGAVLHAEVVLELGTALEPQIAVRALVDDIHDGQ
jgi:hypothetical protein